MNLHPIHTVMYSRSTESINVQVTPVYLEDQSVPDQGHYVWAYNVVIRNDGSKTVQLINRHWHITEGSGYAHEVRGPGVVGEQPVLRPGESFEYTSGTYLSSPNGIMYGTYEMEGEDGRLFDVVIPAFSLDSTIQTARPN